MLALIDTCQPNTLPARACCRIARTETAWLVRRAADPPSRAAAAAAPTHAAPLQPDAQIAPASGKLHSQALALIAARVSADAARAKSPAKLNGSCGGARMRSASAARLRVAPRPRAERPPLRFSPAPAGAAGDPHPAAYYDSVLASLYQECHAHHPFDTNPHRTDPSRACRVLHARILRLGLPLRGRLGDALVDLYGRFGRADCAWRALGCFGGRASDAAASSVLSCHARSGSPWDVLDAFRCIRSSLGGRPDQFGLAVVLSACSRLGVLVYGRQVHCDVHKSGFCSSAFCGAALVDMYAKCGEVAGARRVFDGIACPDTICWTSMIAGYHRVGRYQQALALFSRMKKMGSVLDQVTCVTIISTLASMGRLDDAKTLLKRIHMPSTVAWNAVISSYAQNGLECEVFGLYKDMRRHGFRPTRSTFASMVSAAANMTAFDEGQQVHAAAVRHGLDANVFVGSSLINLYVKHGCISDAKKVFDFSSEKNIVMWNAMLNGFVQINELQEETIEMFQYMRRVDLEVDDFTFVSALGACINMDSLGLGKQVHCITIKNHMDANLFVANATLDMYSKLGAIDVAKALFTLIPDKDNVSWNALIVGLAHNEEEEEAVCMLKRMKLYGITPDEVSFATAINACSNIQATETGKQLHCASVKYNICSNHVVGSSLIDLYSKHGDVESSRKILAQVDAGSIVPRNALITGLVQNNREDEAIELFQQVLKDGFKPSSFTFSSMLSGCTGLLSSVIGKQVHCYTLKSGLLNEDTSLGISLIGIYLKCKMLEDANKLLMEMPDHKNLVEWTAIISGYAQNGYSDQSLVSFWRMRSYDVRSDEATFASVLKACSEIAALTDGNEIHGLIIKSGFVSYKTAISALIDMYSKCGDVISSFEIFKELKNKKDIMPWNSLIVGFAKNGYANEALLLFQKMQESQLKPDEVTFLGVLIACSHAGLISEGRHFFDSMSQVYGLMPRVDHYACFIDLLGRGGHLQEAQEVIDHLPFRADGVIWATYLAACQMHKDEERGKIAAKKLVELEPQSSSTYVFLSSLHAAAGNWVEAKVAREAMREKGVTKFPGCSWITVGNKTSLFVVQDKHHPDTLNIYEILADLTGMIKKDDKIEEYDQLISSGLLA
ncbi:pentatricopeptide repeat-containing protein At3g09040, mitochondrial-like [Phragmites australis]|uniref:pentatricopeptide repeat-containing protein At3g09040, mitochondrial-like n=1 Tax=Phragmites australis TaxID=29695 RepID=UPI002D79F99A|nr:pentatricopeptide repeat-containing protein At3g09040, mitochondrial-like [Phragmites australis]XP_062226153.1 pentatricopeptide repeat-containing protein At3g09040, mitochondrial-like [Phragmites australis]XP_062226154.1 pentatricopeptide repeat-containing protein At3g09040, mitochondrial-like [Phragmites australis]XP_062226155.1 pentatricopeptide repeat-containing protein At3g09040, mitochondrial-like [Phragmites australis]